MGKVAGRPSNLKPSWLRISTRLPAVAAGLLAWAAYRLRVLEMDGVLPDSPDEIAAWLGCSARAVVRAAQSLAGVHWVPRVGIVVDPERVALAAADGPSVVVRAAPGPIGARIAAAILRAAGSIRRAARWLRCDRRRVRAAATVPVCRDTARAPRGHREGTARASGYSREFGQNAPGVVKSTPTGTVPPTPTAHERTGGAAPDPISPESGRSSRPIETISTNWDHFDRPPNSTLRRDRNSAGSAGIAGTQQRGKVGWWDGKSDGATAALRSRDGDTGILAALATAGYRSRYPWVRRHKAKDLERGGVTAELLAEAWSVAKRIARSPSALFARWVDRWQIRSVVADERPKPQRRAVDPEAPIEDTAKRASAVLDGILGSLGRMVG